MIELKAITALMLYLGMTLLFILSIWLFNHYGKRRKPILPPEKNLHTCEFCHFAYLDTPENRITRCPCCKSYNAKDINS